MQFLAALPDSIGALWRCKSEDHDGHQQCPFCATPAWLPKQVLEFRSHALNHVAKRSAIAVEDAIQHPEYCGFCFSASGDCKITVTKDMARFTCKKNLAPKIGRRVHRCGTAKLRLYQLIQCPHPVCNEYIWAFNAQSHRTRRHPNAKAHPETEQLERELTAMVAGADVSIHMDNARPLRKPRRKRRRADDESAVTAEPDMKKEKKLDPGTDEKDGSAAPVVVERENADYEQKSLKTKEKKKPSKKTKEEKKTRKVLLKLTEDDPAERAGHIPATQSKKSKKRKVLTEARGTGPQAGPATKRTKTVSGWPKKDLDWEPEPKSEAKWTGPS